MNSNFKIFTFLFVILFTYGCKESDSEMVSKNTNCLPSSLQNGIIAFYPFNNGSINDFSGNNYHLLNNTSASAGADRAGNTNCAFKFNAANGDFLKYINPTFLDNIQNSPFSLSLWYKNETSSPSKYELLIGRDTGLHCPDTYGQWSLGLYDLRKPVFGINEYSIWWNNTTVDGHEWRHLVATSNGNDLKIYVNGILTLDTASTGCGISNPTINTGDLFLGKEFTGILDDVIIYNRIITPSEISELKSITPCCQ